MIMSALLSHLDLAPLLYGCVIFLGLTIMLGKVMSGRWLSLVIDIAVFALVFRLHGGTMAGGFAATIAALLSGVFFPLMMGRK